MQTPILLLAFNRPDTTQKVFDKIKKIKPKQLFIAQDWPRNKEEEIKTDTVKKIWKIDWDCDVKYLTRSKNLWCLAAVTWAIDRFFEYVEFWIILEDDCIPSIQISKFCEDMDMQYRDNKKIGWISLSNYHKSSWDGKESLLFTKHNPLMWGRATWKDRREKYHSHPQVIKKLQITEWKLLQKKAIKWYMKGWYWDSNRYAVNYANDRSTIIPPINLISNIGYVGIHNQRAGKYHDLSIETYNNTRSKKIENIQTSHSYDQEMIRFIVKMYLYTQIEKLLKKIGIYSIIHKSFITLNNYIKWKK